MDNFADRLINAIERKGTAATIALDPVFSNLPVDIRDRADQGSADSQLSAIGEYARAVIDIVAPLVSVVKINSAYFEAYGPWGVALYHDLIEYAKRCPDVIVIGDVKRGDIGHTAQMYALGHLGGPALGKHALADAITISGYFGEDGIAPFVDAAAANGRGVFVLVRTSNPSAAGLQDLVLSDGRKVDEIVAAQVEKSASQPRLIGERDYSSVGAVVGTRGAADAAKLRIMMPKSFFLAPGYGAQCGKAEDFRPYFNRDGLGALVLAGRSVIYAYENPEHRGSASWQNAVESACKDFVAAIAPLSRR